MHKPGIVSTLKPHTRLCRHNLRKGEQEETREYVVSGVLLFDCVSVAVLLDCV
jgi:hypothetical protein